MPACRRRTPVPRSNGSRSARPAASVQAAGTGKMSTVPCFACRPDGSIDPVQAAEVRQAFSSFVAGCRHQDDRGRLEPPRHRQHPRRRLDAQGRAADPAQPAVHRGAVADEAGLGEEPDRDLRRPGQLGSYRRQRHLPGGGEETGRPGTAQQHERIGAHALRLRPVPLRGMRRPGAGLAEPTDVRHRQRARNTKRSGSSTNAAPRRTSSERLGTLRGVVTVG